jgi:2-polyprenyl-3-methyl-5-hydroxy-6-metoxy-1,4-benzoquinol methylase
MSCSTAMLSDIHCNLCATPVLSTQLPRWRKHGHEIYRCRLCGLLFRAELPSASQLLSIYSPQYFHRDGDREADGYANYLSDERDHRLTARQRVQELNRVMSPGRLLDVGSAAGFFLDEARTSGWKVQGIDVSPQMSAWGREQLGLDIASGLFQEADYPASQFDAVTMWDYIEHSIDPAHDFAKAAHVLRPGGMLMLSTGDAASLVARLSGKRWHLLVPRYHNFFFSMETLTRYLEREGFEVVKARHSAAYYSLRYAIYKLATMAPASRVVRALGEWTSAHPLGERSLRLSLGDIVTVHARLDRAHRSNRRDKPAVPSGLTT